VSPLNWKIWPGIHGRVSEPPESPPRRAAGSLLGTLIVASVGLVTLLEVEVRVRSVSTPSVVVTDVVVVVVVVVVLAAVPVGLRVSLLSALRRARSVSGLKVCGLYGLSCRKRPRVTMTFVVVVSVTCVSVVVVLTITGTCGGAWSVCWSVLLLLTTLLTTCCVFVTVCVMTGGGVLVGPWPEFWPEKPELCDWLSALLP